MVETISTDYDSLEMIRAKASFILYDDAGTDYSVVKYSLEEGRNFPNGNNQFIAFGYGLPKDSNLTVELQGEWVFSAKYNQSKRV